MSKYFQIVTVVLVSAGAVITAANSADDWSFVAGKYAVEKDDCKHLAKGRPFSKALVKNLDGEVLTREGITSPRETHCKFRSSSKVAGDKPGWAVKAACEELGKVSQETIAVASGPDGALVVTSEDVFGPPLTFLLCPK
jgi:hypothetical protein